jgi:hypothetical protein
MTPPADAPPQALPVGCPRCGRPPIASDRCASCGFPLTGDAVGRLRVIAGRLGAIRGEQEALLSEATALREEQSALLRALGGAGPQEFVPPTRRPAARPESRPEMVRDVLLWLGSVLVAVAALTFALFAWRRLGDTGRASLLFFMTFVAAGAARATYRRLPQTAEALGGLTLALFLVDWFVLRRGGVGAGLSASVWWSMGTGMAAGLAVAAAPWLKIQAVAAAVLVQVAAVLLVVDLADASWTIVLVLALVGVPLAAIAGRLSHSRTWIVAAAVLGVGLVLMELAALSVVGDSFVLDDGAVSLQLAAVLVAMALAPAAARLTVSAADQAKDALVGISAACLLGAVAVLMAAATSSTTSFLAAVAVLGTAGIGLARFMPVVVRTGSLWAASGALGVGVLQLVDSIGRAVVGPLSWLEDVWEAGLTGDALTSVTFATGSTGLAFTAALVALLALGAAAVLLMLPVRGGRLVPEPVAWAVGAIAVVGIVATAPLAASAPIWVVTLVTGAGAVAAMGAAAEADRRARLVTATALAAVAGALALPALGWALATEGGTVAFLAVLVAGAAAAAARSQTAAFRQVLGAVTVAGALGEGAAVAASAGVPLAPVGLVVAMVGGAALVAGALWRKAAPEGVTVEAVGTAGLVLGAALAATDEPWLAIVLTVAVGWVMAAGSRPARAHYLLAGAATAVAATWAWLVVLDVTLVEAYTLPAAAMALAAGTVARRRMPALSSWTAFGPGLGIGLVPSVALVLAEGGFVRSLAVTVAALLVLLAGARTRLQAPLVLGGGALLVVGLEALWPVAALIPRWAVIGTVGVLLLWLGATAEHRLLQLRELAGRFRDLEPHGPLGSSA